MWKYFKVVIKVLFPLIFDYFTWILRYSLNPTKYSFEKRFNKVQKIVRKILNAFGVKIKVNNYEEYSENLKNTESLIYVCNHISFIDPLVFIAIAKRPFSIVAKKETKKMVLVGRIVKILEGEFLDREDLKQQLKCFMRVQKNLEEKNRDYVIFPEGTRSQDYNMKTFHHGSFRPAFKLKKPIYICSVVGCPKVLDIKDKGKYYPINFNFIEKINYDFYQNKTTNEIAEYAENLIKENINEVRPLNETEYNKINKIKN